MAVTLTYPTLTTSPASKAELESNFTTLAQKFGNITNADVASGAGLDIDKLSAQYEYLPISVRLTDGTAANDQFVPVYNDGKGNWTVVATQWATADTGTPTGTCILKIEWGVYDEAATPGAFTVAATIDTVALAGTAIASQGVDTSPTTATLTFGSAGVYRSLRFYVSTVDADCESPIYVTLQLKRKIAT